MTGQKQCTGCHQLKPLDAFSPLEEGKDGRRSRCKTCAVTASTEYKRDNRQRVTDNSTAHYHRRGYATRLRRLHGQAGDYELLLTEAGGRCQGCGAAPDPGRRLAVDHDHQTGRVRGLLCDGCNVTVGLFDDDPATLRAAAAYLRRTPPLRR